MSQISHFRAFGLVLAVSLVGCSDPRSALATDTLLSRDLTLAAQDAQRAPAVDPSTLGDTARTTPTTPAPSEAPRRAPTTSGSAPNDRRPATTPAPARTPVAMPNATPAPAPAAPTPASPAGVGTSPRPARGLAAGAILSGRTEAAICTPGNRAGDRFVVTLATDVAGPDGALLAAGTPVLVELAASDSGGFAFRAKAVQVDGTLLPIDATVRADGALTSRRVSNGGDRGKVIAGAVAGAVLGRVLGGTRGTVIGAAGGAAAGTVAAARNATTERCLPAGSTLEVTLAAPLVLTPGTP